MKPLIVITLAALLAFPASAGDRPDGRGKHEELRTRVQEKVGAWLTTEISTRLGLDATKSAKLSESIRAHIERKQERGQKLRAEMQKLRSLVDAKAADAQVKAQLDVVIGASSRDDDVHELLRDTARFMTVQEQARLALAMPEIMQEMRKVMREARRDGRGEGRGRRGPGGGFGGPPIDDDEL